MASLAAVAAFAAGLALVWIKPWSGEPGSDLGAGAPARPKTWTVGTPKDLLVPFSLNRQPVPGWRASTTDIGLAQGVHVGDLFASIGARAYFVTTHCDDGPCSHPTGWLYGLDIGSGKRLFAPVLMDGFYGGATSCYTNGPSVALCVNGGYRQDRPQLVWVIDLDHGAVTYSGPTDLHPQAIFGAGPEVRAVGNNQGETRLIATVKGKGAYGIGSRAELTWFVPGDGNVPVLGFLTASDIPPVSLALQARNLDDHSGPRDRVFSVIDGKDVIPRVPAGVAIDHAAVYSGGFAYHYQQGASQGVMFFDTDGRELARQELGFAAPLQNAALPTFVINPLSKPEWVVYTGDGRLLARMPGDPLAAEFQTIGSKLYIKRGPTGPEESWQQWDLLTGNPGPTCKMHLGSAYVASDGNVVVSRESDRVVAVESSTCQVLWETPSEPDDDRVVIWKVEGGLLERTRRSDSVTSLGPAA